MLAHQKPIRDLPTMMMCEPTHTQNRLRSSALQSVGGTGQGVLRPNLRFTFVVSNEKYAHIHANQVIVVKNKWIELGLKIQQQ